MQKLRSKLTGILLGLTAFSGCAPRQGYLVSETDYQRPSVEHVSTGVDDIELRRVTNADVEYERRRAVVNGLEMYVRKNDTPKADELGFILIPEREVTLRRGLNTTEEDSEFLYIPTLVSNQGVKTKIKLKHEGMYGVSASIRRHPVDSVESGYVVEHEGDIVYNVKTTTIAGKEYFTPRVEDSEKDKDSALNFYLTEHGIRTDGTDITSMLIDRKDGTITLEAKSGFYRPLRVKKEDYTKRIMPTTIRTSVETTGATLSSE